MKAVKSAEKCILQTTALIAAHKRFAEILSFPKLPCFVPLKLSALGKALLNLKEFLFPFRLNNVSDTD